MLSKRQIGELINKHCIALDLRTDVVACIVIQESNGDTFAWRWEEQFYYNKLASRPRESLAGFVPKAGTLPSLVDECLQRSCSYGLMQVLGDTARWCVGITNPYLSILFDPDRGIEAGCKVLSFYLNKANGDYKRALKNYNGSWDYVTKIMTRIDNQQHKQFFEGEL